jgi:hypothetical protein
MVPPENRHVVCDRSHPFLLLGLCSIAAAIAGGRADRIMEERQSVVRELGRQEAVAASERAVSLFG